MEFSDAIPDGAYVVLFFAGHGERMEDSFLMPVDGDRSTLAGECVVTNITVRVTVTAT